MCPCYLPCLPLCLLPASLGEGREEKEGTLEKGMRPRTWREVLPFPHLSCLPPCPCPFTCLLPFLPMPLYYILSPSHLSYMQILPAPQFHTFVVWEVPPYPSSILPLVLVCGLLGLDSPFWETLCGVLKKKRAGINKEKEEAEREREAERRRGRDRGTNRKEKRRQGRLGGCLLTLLLLHSHACSNMAF